MTDGMQNRAHNHNVSKILKKQVTSADDCILSSSNLRVRSHRHTTSWTLPSDLQGTQAARERASTVAPILPPKQHKRSMAARPEAMKTRSLETHDYQRSFKVSYDRDSTESNYINVNDIATLPARSQTTRIRAQPQRMMNHTRPVPNKPVLKVSVKPPPLIQRNNDHQQHQSDHHRLTGKLSSSPTLLTHGNTNMFTETRNLTEMKPFRPVSPIHIRPRSPLSTSSEFGINKWIPHATVHGTLTSSTGEPLAQEIQAETAIYGAAQGRGSNLVMDFNRIRVKLTSLYKKIADMPEDSASMMDLKTHLKLMEHETTSDVLQSVYTALAPSSENRGIESEMMYVVDFRRFRDKSNLRQQIIQMFAKPGPPSISYTQVDAKMDGIITEFSARVEALRSTRNEFIESPSHARDILQGQTDTESLVKALRENQLWIRWGTPTNLPPLSHLYMHKQPPSYEVRKAVTISFIAERQKAMHDTFKSVDPKALCPPIYSRLKTGSSNETLWQVTEYNEQNGNFENRRCQLPSWLDEEQSAKGLLKSSNRTIFDADEHPYALYSVYVIIIKDFTLAQEDSSRKHEREFSKSTPTKCQYYVGSSSTGVLYQFTQVENNHCSRAFKVLREASTLKHYRCYEGCDLIEACLALSWARRQPRAVFVLNSFLPRNMTNLTLELKQPFKERMLALTSSLINGKKTGPLCDMRYGMNGTTTIQDDEGEI